MSGNSATAHKRPIVRKKLIASCNATENGVFAEEKRPGFSVEKIPKKARTQLSIEEGEIGEDSKNKTIRCKSVCSNQLDRLCDLLLKWDFVKEVNQFGTTASLAAIASGTTGSIFRHVETVFSKGYTSYLDIFEPLVIEEIRATVLTQSQPLLMGVTPAQEGTLYAPVEIKTVGMSAAPAFPNYPITTVTLTMDYAGTRQPKGPSTESARSSSSSTTCRSR